MSGTPRLPLRFYLAPFILCPWWAVCRARRHPAPVVAVVAALVMITGIGAAAVSAPVKGCSFRVVAGRGERAHMVCEAGSWRSEMAATREAGR